jgi:hypothetical protein
MLLDAVGIEFPSCPQQACPLPTSHSEVRRSGRHVTAEDGSGATDEDMMQKAMRRKAVKNLNYGGTKKNLLLLLLIFKC